tara:strand:+ start:182 stop:376 length:195 start_codon:yes stop_codon:yes gene_type:complete
MKVTIDLKFFIPAVIAFILAYMTVTYKIDEYITFAGEDNALAFFLMSSTMGMMLMIGAFTKDKK